MSADVKALLERVAKKRGADDLPDSLAIEATYKVVVKGVAVGDVRFKVSLTSDQMTKPAEETESTHIYK